MPLKDKEKRREYHRNYLKRKFQEDQIYKQKHLKRVKLNDEKYTKLRKDVLSDFRKNGCSFCSEKEPCCMDAHHVSNKKFNIGEMVARKFSVIKIKIELEKCICVCKNCHAKIHAGLIVAE
jgi:hypothetical protein